MTLGPTPSKADSDLWMRDAGDHYEHAAPYCEDLLVRAKDPMAILDLIRKPQGPYGLKGVDSPKYYLGDGITVMMGQDFIEKLSTLAKTYVKCITDNVVELMDWDLRKMRFPEDPDYHPDLNGSPPLLGDDVTNYCMMVGCLNWMVTLGRYGIIHAANTMVQYMMLRIHVCDEERD